MHIHMPEAARERLKEVYKTASVILEYGAGGSTAYAASVGARKVMCVETDKMWIASLQKQIDTLESETEIHLCHGDVGPVGNWGVPLTKLHWRKYPRYSLGIWSEPYFEQPDVVLVDGRFRLGCVAATMLCTRAPVTLLFDDYLKRPRYSAIERFIKPVALHSRMAEFRIEPGQVKPEDMADLVSYMIRTRQPTVKPRHIPKLIWDFVSTGLTTHDVRK